MKDTERDFRKAIYYDTSKGIQYKPDDIAKVIKEEQDIKITQLLRGTPNEKLLAYSDPKVQELVHYIIAAIMYENEIIISPDKAFPLVIHSRYKSNTSLKNKVKQKDEVTDYLGFTILPEVEHDIFYSEDPVLQEMIDRREEVRNSMTIIYKKLSSNRKITFSDYCDLCNETFNALKKVWIDKSANKSDYGSERFMHYDELQKILDKNLQEYNCIVANPKTKMSFDEILKNCTSIDIKELLAELGRKLNNEVNLYQLTSNLESIFQNSSILSNLRYKYGS